MMRARRQRIIPLLVLNLVLIVVLVFVLEHFKIFSWQNVLGSGSKASKTDKPKAVVEDPFLLEKESLRKQWRVLAEKERLYKEKAQELAKKEKLLKEKLTEADKQIKIAKDMQKKQKVIKQQYEDRQANIRDLANKIGNMPPEDGVALLEAQNSLVSVDIIREMDAIARRTGKSSITAFLISKMNRKKAGEIIRLMSRYPIDPKKKASQ